MTSRLPPRGGHAPAPPASELTLTPPPGLRAAALPGDCDEFVLIGWDAGGAPDLSRLTDAERDVVRLVAANVPNEEIARRRGTSRATVARQLAGALSKLGVRSRCELLAKLAAQR